MPLNSFRPPLNFTNIAFLTSGASFAFTNQQAIIVNKTVGSPTAVSLPIVIASPRNYRTVFIKDGKGDAQTNNITITDPNGNLIDGATSLVLSTNFGTVTLVWNGSQWSALTPAGSSGNLPFGSNVAIFTGTGTYTFTTASGVIVNKAVGASTPVSLPSSPATYQTAFIKDGKGDAQTNNITITDPNSNTIDGAASFVINSNYGSVLLIWNGTQWNVLLAFDSRWTVGA